MTTPQFNDRRFLLGLAVCSLAALTTQPAHAQPGRTETIAITGAPAPETESDTVFDGIGTPVLNDAGQVAYMANLSGPNVEDANHVGIWQDDTLIVRAGEPAEGTSDGTFFGVRGQGYLLVRLNDNGQVSYAAPLSGAGITPTNNSGIWRDNSLIAREGSQAPQTTPGTVFSSVFANGAFFNLVLNNAGQTSYRVKLDGPGVSASNDHGIWRDDTLIARAGNQAPGTREGTVFEFLNAPVINDSGQVAYLGSLANSGTDGILRSGIWRDDTLIALDGNPAPGTSPGTVFENTLGIGPSPTLNNAGQVAYLATLTGPDVDRTNQAGIWINDHLIVREGNPAPGTSPGTVFHLIRQNPVLNDRGQVAYAATLMDTDRDNGNQQSLWLDDQLVVRSGEPAPGTNPGTNFAGLSGFGLNEGGQVFYRALLTGQGVTNDLGYWITGPNGDSLLAVRLGDVLAGRIVTHLSAIGLGDGNPGSGGSSGRASSFNNFSQIAYQAFFSNTGESGVFLFTPNIHWTGPSAERWSHADNWTIGQLPGLPHDVFINPDTPATITGPTTDATVKSLTVGGGDAPATLHLAEGSITTTDGLFVADNGTLAGPGTIMGDVLLQGTLRFVLTGDDQTLVIDGLLNLDGATLEIVLADGFNPKTGDIFDILDWSELTGEFSDMILSTLPSGRRFDDSALLTTGQLTVIPEPVPLITLLLALACPRPRHR